MVEPPDTPYAHYPACAPCLPFLLALFTFVLNCPKTQTRISTDMHNFVSERALNTPACYQWMDVEKVRHMCLASKDTERSVAGESYPCYTEDIYFGYRLEACDCTKEKAFGAKIFRGSGPGRPFLIGEHTNHLPRNACQGVVF